MCGVIGLVYGRSRDDLGRIASALLRMLEYRGYDSTGAAIQGEGPEVRLLKGVGAPSLLVRQLGIEDQRGRILCGQVRWATFGAVDAANAQPHEVACKHALYGAHNGNVTNCDELKAWLTSEGHQVLSNNDGEMVVHTLEHYFARELDAHPVDRRGDPATRRQCMRAAICSANARLEGSFAAVIVDPQTGTLWSIKRGSSLYFGVGGGGPEDAFTIASSDLSAVLKLTRVLVPLKVGEAVEHTGVGYQVYRVSDPEAGAVPVERSAVRSRLRAEDTALSPPFETFMDQEISAQEQTCRDVIRLFSGGAESTRALSSALAACSPGEREALSGALDRLCDQVDDERLEAALVSFAAMPVVTGVLERCDPEIARRLTSGTADQVAARMCSAEAGFLRDLLPMARDERDVLCVRLMDAIIEAREADELNASIARFTELCLDSLRRGGRIIAVCCGSSYNAAKAAALFFNEIARVELVCVLPGEYRGQVSRTLRDGDLFVAVSQSGETKDLIDVLNDVEASGRDVRKVGLVNNVNSTLAQEKSDVVIPLRCGAEIAVPATKSFMNQMAVFYCMALRLAEARLEHTPSDFEAPDSLRDELRDRLDKLVRLPDLLRETFDTTDADIERAAQLLFLRPSVQILATRITAVAKEGALKIREVVLNHTEGFEGSEFKHGPNTILGLNTLYGPLEVDALLKHLGNALQEVTAAAVASGLDTASVRRLEQAATDAVFSPTATQLSLSTEERSILDSVVDREALLDTLRSDYPLIYITGPSRRDVHLTVSQINTHKIRGSQTVVIAEDHPELRQASGRAPAGSRTYQSVYVALPRTNDTLMTMFSSVVVLQRLALKMSQLKAHYLDRIGIKEHGVHPDVPKNVSKSITVD